MAGLSVKNELFAIRLLELTRLLEPEGNRVRFVTICQSHGIRGFLQKFPETWERITDNPPREGIKPSAQYRIECAAFALKIAAFQERLVRELDRIQVPVLSVKGLSLSKVLHGDICEREFGDLDLLVSPRDIRRVADHLDQIGLVRTYPSGLSPNQEAAFFHYLKAQNFRDPGSASTLDLHWKLLSSWVGTDLLPFDDLWQRSRLLEREGLTSWRTLGDEDTLVFLALHGYQDGWPRLKQFLDLAVALEVLDYDWNRVLEIADYRACLVERAVELCVRLLGVPHPAQMTHHYRDYEHALSSWREMAKAPKTPQTKLLSPIYWSCDSSTALQKSFKALFAPAIDDIQSIDIPASLLRLYPVVRFFRLIQKAITRKSVLGVVESSDR